MLTLDQAARRLMFMTDGPGSAAGAPATPADAIAALEASDGAGADAADAEAAEPADDADDTDPEGAEELGDKGKQALDRMKEKLRAEKAKRLAAEQKLTEKVGEDDTARIEREATAKANQRIVRAELKTAAKGVVNDAALSDIFALIPKTDLEAIEVDDDGNVDEDEVTALIADLVAKKPYLAAQGGPKPPKVDPSQGAVGGAPASAADRFAAQFANKI